MRMLIPDVYLNAVTELIPEFLLEQGRCGLLLDIDGTLKDFPQEAVGDHILEWLNLLRQADVKLCLVSNGRVPRIRRLAESMDLPFVAEALKPSPKGCRRAMRLLGLQPKQVAIAGDQLFADHLAGRLAGLYTILVRPTSRIEPWFTRIKRPFESIVVRRLTAGLPNLAETREHSAAGLR